MSATTHSKFWTVLFAGTLLFGCGPGDSPPDDQHEGTPGETIESDLERDKAPDVDDEIFEQFTEDNRDFSFSLFDQLREEEDEDENIFVSPHSISIALAMTYAGAEENTKDEMAEVLRFQLDDDELHPAFNRLDLELDERSEVATDDDDDEPFELDVVNQTWGQEDFSFLDQYLDLLAVHYGAAMKAVDFTADFEQIREDINAWVEEQTNDRIVDLLPEGSLDHLTRFVLVNAIYFYGSWEHPFDEDVTSDEDFHLLDGSTTEVPLMTETARFGYYTGDDTIAASLPYVGEEVSLVAMMPADEDDDFAGWENDFGRADFDEVVDGLSHGDTRVHFPSFEDEADFVLSETLEDMGMVDAFDDCAADFTGITGGEPCIPFESLYISEIFHQSFVSIDEEGTEAAAATAVVMDVEDGSVGDPPPEIRFDRPFHYAIFDHETETILFYGRMVDPS